MKISSFSKSLLIIGYEVCLSLFAIAAYSAFDVFSSTKQVDYFADFGMKILLLCFVVATANELSILLNKRS